jgi:Domain of unknown function (DUF4148)
MNTKSLLTFAVAAVAVSAFASTAAMAQEVSVDTTPFHATTTRAEVRAEVLKAHAAGVLQFSTELDAHVQPAMAAAPSMLTREQVRAEARTMPRSNRRADASYSAA